MAKTAYTKILNNSQESMNENANTENLRVRILCYRGLAKVQFKKECWEKSLEFLNNEMDSVVDMYGEYHSEYVLCLEDKIDIFHRMGNEILCFKSLAQAIGILEDTSISTITNSFRQSKLSDLYLKMSQMMTELDRYSDAVKYLEKLENMMLLESSTNSVQPISRFSLYETLGMLHLLLEDYTLCEKCFKTCIEVATNDNDVHDIKQSLMNIVSAKQL